MKIKDTTKQMEEQIVDMICEWHKIDPYPPIRPLAAQLLSLFASEKKRLLQEIEEKDTLKDFEEYCVSNMEQAGDACTASEGTQGCDEANFMSDILKTIQVYKKIISSMK